MTNLKIQSKIVYTQTKINYEKEKLSSIWIMLKNQINKEED
jgi:hypothetical protein